MFKYVVAVLLLFSFSQGAYAAWNDGCAPQSAWGGSNTLTGTQSISNVKFTGQVVIEAGANITFNCVEIDANGSRYGVQLLGGGTLNYTNGRVYDALGGKCLLLQGTYDVDNVEFEQCEDGIFANGGGSSGTLNNVNCIQLDTFTANNDGNPADGAHSDCTQYYGGGPHVLQNSSYTCRPNDPGDVNSCVAIQSGSFGQAGQVTLTNNYFDGGNNETAYLIRIEDKVGYPCPGPVFATGNTLVAVAPVFGPVNFTGGGSCNPCNNGGSWNTNTYNGGALLAEGQTCGAPASLTSKAPTNFTVTE